MKASAHSIRLAVSRLRSLPNEIWPRIISTSVSPTIEAEKAVSNLHLNLEKLDAFYADENRSSYFPYLAETELNSHLAAIEQKASEFGGSPTSEIADALVGFSDGLYTVSLRYGLITFGLDGNEIKTARAEAKSFLENIRSTSEKIHGEAKNIVARVHGIAEETQNEFSQKTDDLKKKLESVLAQCQEQATRLEVESGRSKEKLDEIEEERQSLAKIITQINDLNAQAAKAAKESIESSVAIGAELKSGQETRAKLKTEADQITEFYKTIEIHQGTMAEVQKKSEAKFNALNDNHDKLQKIYQQQTDAVVKKNQDLLKQIEGHLQRAIGASLFGAFDTRRKGLFWGRWIWMGIMIASVVAAGVLSYSLASSLTESGSAINGSQPQWIELAFFIKLSAVIPITFALIFSARQYTNERRTEEEYAFKSSISFSLEPYKTLLQQMKNDGHEAQASFVEKLLTEIFDNPVKRIYGDRERNSQTKSMSLRDVKALAMVSKDFDLSKAKELIEFIQSGSGHR
jgi:Mg2+ and Co2+ transporter CorA